MQTKTKKFNLKEIYDRSIDGERKDFSMNLEKVKTLTSDILENCAIFNNLGDLLSGILPGVDLSKINREVLEYKNFQSFSLMDSGLYDHSINYFIESINRGDKQETKKELLDMMVNYMQIPHDIAYTIVDNINLETVVVGKKIDLDKKDYIDSEELKNKLVPDLEAKLFALFKNHKLVEGLLSSEFSLKELNIFFQVFNNYTTFKNEHLESFSYLGSGKQAGAMIHLLNLIGEEKSGTLRKSYQIAMEDQDMFILHVGSHTKLPVGEGLVLFEYDNRAIGFTEGILSSVLERDSDHIYKNTKIVDAMTIVNDKRFEYQNERKSPLVYNDNNDSINLKFDKNIEDKIIQKIIDKYSFYVEKNDIGKDFFLKDEFLINLSGKIDIGRTLNNSAYLILAATILYNEIKLDFDFDIVKDLYIHYPREIEYSLTYLVSIMIKKDYPNINIITDKKQISNFIESDDYDEDKLLDIKLINNFISEDEFVEDALIVGKHEFENSFSIYSDRIKNIKL